MTAEKIAAPERATPATSEDLREAYNLLKFRAVSAPEHEKMTSCNALAERLLALADQLSSPTPTDEEIRQAVEAVCAAGYDVGDAILGEESTAASHRAADAKLHLLSLIERRVQQQELQRESTLTASTRGEQK